MSPRRIVRGSRLGHDGHSHVGKRQEQGAHTSTDDGATSGDGFGNLGSGRRASHLCGGRGRWGGSGSGRNRGVNATRGSSRLAGRRNSRLNGGNSGSENLGWVTIERGGCRRLDRSDGSRRRHLVRRGWGHGNRQARRSTHRRGDSDGDSRGTSN
jgi:hypothetical protein